MPSRGTERTSFRLDRQTLADLDAIAALLHEHEGRPDTRADALRYAARDTRQRLEKKFGKTATVS